MGLGPVGGDGVRAGRGGGWAGRRAGPGRWAHVAHAADALGRAVPSKRRSRAPTRRPWTAAAGKLAGFGGDRREWTDPGVGAPDLVPGEVDAPHMAGGEAEQHGGGGVPAARRERSCEGGGEGRKEEKEAGGTVWPGGITARLRRPGGDTPMTESNKGTGRSERGARAGCGPGA